MFRLFRRRKSPLSSLEIVAPVEAPQERSLAELLEIVGGTPHGYPTYRSLDERDEALDALLEHELNHEALVKVCDDVGRHRASTEQFRSLMGQRNLTGKLRVGVLSRQVEHLGSDRTQELIDHGHTTREEITLLQELRGICGFGLIRFDLPHYYLVYWLVQNLTPVQREIFLGVATVHSGPFVRERLQEVIQYIHTAEML